MFSTLHCYAFSVWGLHKIDFQKKESIFAHIICGRRFHLPYFYHMMVQKAPEHCSSQMKSHLVYKWCLKSNKTKYQTWWCQTQTLTSIFLLTQGESQEQKRGPVWECTLTMLLSNHISTYLKKLMQRNEVKPERVLKWLVGGSTNLHIHSLLPVCTRTRLNGKNMSRGLQ